MGKSTVLADLRIGEAADVLAIGGTGAVAVRLLEMGFVPGTRVRVVKVAPLGDPLELQLRGYHVSLRRAEARRIEVARR